jgi:hypothetical protein
VAKPKSGVNPGRIAPKNMDQREFARFLSENGVQGANDEYTFTPSAWGGFSAAPTGVLHYVDYGHLVHIWTEELVTGTSNDVFMTLVGMPESIWPLHERYLRCLVVSDSEMLGGIVLINDAGGMGFFVEATDLVTNRVAFDADFAATGIKGLPSGFLITYPK